MKRVSIVLAVAALAVLTAAAVPSFGATKPKPTPTPNPTPTAAPPPPCAFFAGQSLSPVFNPASSTVKVGLSPVIDDTGTAACDRVTYAVYVIANSPVDGTAIVGHSEQLGLTNNKARFIVPLGGSGANDTGPSVCLYFTARLANGQLTDRFPHDLECAAANASDAALNEASGGGSYYN